MKMNSEIHVNHLVTVNESQITHKDSVCLTFYHRHILKQFAGDGLYDIILYDFKFNIDFLKSISAIHRSLIVYKPK